MHVEPVMTPNAEALLAHTDWIHDLARSLVTDPELAADLAQETCARALAEPQPIRNTPGWLSRVLANLRVQWSRHEAVRRRHLPRLASAEGVVATAEVVSRVQIHRLVVEAALALDAIYRDVTHPHRRPHSAHPAVRARRSGARRRGRIHDLPDACVG